MSLIKISDSDFENLIDYFKTVEEDTLIIFFGDHQPNDSVAYSILSDKGMNYKDLNEEELKLRYKVPYVIWANFDIEEEKDRDTSLNYLAAEALDISGVKLSGYQNFLLELKKSYPVISTVNIQSVDENEKIFEQYKQIQYYKLFGQKGN